MVNLAYSLLEARIESPADRALTETNLAIAKMTDSGTSINRSIHVHAMAALNDTRS
jgi:hypothetical protein